MTGLQISCSVYVPKITKIGWQYRQSYCKNKRAYFLAHPVHCWQYCLYNHVVSMLLIGQMR